MKIFIYVRVSTSKQDLNSCLQECGKYVREKYFGLDVTIIGVVCSTRANFQERRITELLQLARKGDIIVSSELTRIARSTDELRLLFFKLQEMGIEIEFVRSDHNFFNHPKFGGVMREILCLFAEFERDCISERTKAGLARIKAKGVKLGRKYAPNYLHPKILSKKPEIENYLENKVAKSAICRIIGVNIKTFNKYLKQRDTFKV